MCVLSGPLVLHLCVAVIASLPCTHAGRMRVNEAVLLFDCHVLRHLKQECGGLQTLLRNHHQVFCGVSLSFVVLIFVGTYTCRYIHIYTCTCTYVHALRNVNGCTLLTAVHSQMYMYMYMHDSCNRVL